VSPADSSPSPDELAARVAGGIGDRHVFERFVGVGGHATVFLARDLKHERPVAIKVLRQELSSSVSAERFLREILIAAGLTHPNILPVFDSGSEQGILYYVMPYIAGETLGDRLAREGALSITDTLRLTREMAAALQHAHDGGLVHRDIKPANVLLSGGVAVVADFGLARAIAPTRGSLELTMEGSGLGTPSYMSPEQALGIETIDAATDQYSLACVVFEMLTGRRPFEGNTFQGLVSQHITGAPPDATSLRAEIPEHISAAIIRALAKAPEDRFPSVAAFVDELSGATHRTSTHRFWTTETKVSRRQRIGLIGFSVLVATAAVWLAWDRFGGSVVGRPLDKDLVAVAPFSVPEKELAVWREGLAEVVARNLDGAGPLHTVSMTVINRGWNGRIDAGAMTALGRRSGAATAVSGTLLQKGRDSVRVTATVYDVAGKRSLGEVDLTEETVQMGRLAERFTIEVLRRLGRNQQLAAARMAGAHVTPLLALKAFLQGEYHFRRTGWDSAMTNYRRAIELDPAMTLAYLRMSMVSGWQRLDRDTLISYYARTAAQLNHGLAPRESLLVVTEALKATLRSRMKDSAYASHAEQLFQTLETATQVYPTDREFWYSLGNARANIMGNSRDALAALDRSIAIDSGFAPAYLDAVTVAMALGKTEDARRYLAAYLALNPSDVHGDGLRLASQMLDPSRSAAGMSGVLDTASAEILVHAIDVLAYWPDSAESTVRLARLLAEGRRSVIPEYREPSFTSFQLSYTLAFRGHLEEANSLLAPDPKNVRAVFQASLALMTSTSSGRANSHFASLKTGRVDSPTGLVLALPWWSEKRDTQSLRSTAERAELAIRGGVHGSGGRYTRYLGGAARAYLALAKGDTSGAVARLMALQASDCMYPFCPYEPLQTAILLSQLGRQSEAWKIIDEIPYYYLPMAVRWRLVRARVAEKLGKTDEARRAYAYVAAAWKKADPYLQPELNESEAGLRRLGAASR